MCPNIVEHDDEEVDSNYFNIKTSKSSYREKKKIEMEDLHMYK